MTPNERWAVPGRAWSSTYRNNDRAPMGRHERAKIVAHAVSEAFYDTAEGLAAAASFDDAERWREAGFNQIARHYGWTFKHNERVPL